MQYSLPAASRSDWELLGLIEREHITDSTANKLLRMLRTPGFRTSDLSVATVATMRSTFNKTYGDCNVEAINMHLDVDGEQEVIFWTRDALEVAHELLDDPKAQGLQYLKFVRSEDGNGNRIFGPANGGLWWEKAQAQNPDSCILAVIIGSDSAQHGKNGSVHPISVTLANTPSHLRSYPQMARLVGLAPVLRQVPESPHCTESCSTVAP
jgi:hypothetical protein